MTLQVSTLVGLAEDQGCVPRAYMVVHNHLKH